MFKPLTKDNIGHIVDLLLKGLNKRLADQELTVELELAANSLSLGRLRPCLRRPSLLFRT